MADDKKKKISLGGIDNAAEEKGSFMKTLWQLVKFLVVSGLVTIIQLVLANVLPFIFDGVTATLPVFCCWRFGNLGLSASVLPVQPDCKHLWFLSEQKDHL